MTRFLLAAVASLFSFSGAGSFVQSASAQLSGMYTIDASLPTAGSNFASFTDAASALNMSGVSGPVVIEVADGTYTEQFAINLGYDGTDGIGANAPNPTNTIVFRPQTGASPVVQFDPTSTANHVVKLDGAAFLTFEGMTFKADTDGNEGVYGRVFRLADFCLEVKILDNTIVGLSSVSTNGENLAPIYQTPDGESISLEISGNTIVHGYYGVYANTSSVSTSTVIENNFFDSPTVMVVNMVNHDDIRFVGNVATGSAVTTLQALDDALIEGNTLPGWLNTGGSRVVINANSISGWRGIALSGTLGSADNWITNNEVYVTGTVVETFGLSVTPDSVYILHNSVWIHNTGPSAHYGIHVSQFVDNLSMANNAVLATHDVGAAVAVPLRVESGAGIDFADGNGYYTDGTSLINWFGTGYATLASFVGAVAHEQNSIEADPGFVSADPIELRPTNAAFDGSGIAWAGISTDIDFSDRTVHSPADIGAYVIDGGLPIEFAEAPRVRVNDQNAAVYWKVVDHRDVLEAGRFDIELHQLTAQSAGSHPEEDRRVHVRTQPKFDGDTYSAQLADLAPGRYRLRIVGIDIDGSRTASPSVEFVIVSLVDDGFWVGAPYPSPAWDLVSVDVQYSTPLAGHDGSLTSGRVAPNVEAKLYDISGRVVSSSTLDLGSPSSRVRVTFPVDALAPGVYYMRIRAASRVETRAVVVQ